MSEAISKNTLLQALKPRDREAHKGHFGHVLVIGGNQGYSGAARMAAEAALVVGAGCVSIATHPLHAATLNIGRPELMVHGMPDAKALAPLLVKASVIILGPGLGGDAWAKTLFKTVITLSLPLIVDADALTLLAHHPLHRSDWILTPHPGEASRLLDRKIDNRVKAVTDLQHHYGGICVLKGAGTLVFDGKDYRLCTSGNPGMATAGMGDVLTGVIAGLLAQGLTAMTAAQLGVVLHADAADMAANALGERGLLATHLFPYLRAGVNGLS